MKLLLSAFALFASVAAASGDALIDYNILFENHAEKVVVTNNGGLVYRNLDLGDGVKNRCKGAEGYDDCISIIFAEDGIAPDCLLASTAFTFILARRCETGSAIQRLMLEKAFEGLGETVARNAVPPRDWPDLRRFVLERVEPQVPKTCENMDRSQRDVLASRLRMKELQRIQEYSVLKRLPVGRCLD